jgi:hypothetical protein
VPRPPGPVPRTVMLVTPAGTSQVPGLAGVSVIEPMRQPIR